MKKSAALLLCLALCLVNIFPALAQQTDPYAVGSTVILGSYEQDNQPDNGKEPLEWTVLQREEDRVLLITKYCIDARPYNTDFVPMTWAQCTLRVWLNDAFLQETFTPGEQERILSVPVINEDNTHYNIEGGEDTVDRVYLLSYAEVFQFFPGQEDRQAQATPYAAARGAYVEEATGNAWWWLRSPGNRPIDACGVRVDGRVSGYGSRDVYRPSGSLRPVLWLDTTEK